jgi:uncharacterized protein (TIGR02300 family)
MAKAELGHKQRCGSCGIKFYDLNKTPIICPSCQTEFDPESLLKSRRGRSPAKAEQKAVVAGAEASEEEEIITEVDDDKFEEDDDVLPTGDEPLIAIASEDDGDEAEGGSELIDVLDDEEPLGTGDDLDDEEDDT